MSHTPALKRTATISACGLYRYALTRRWGAGAPVTFIMLNPSTADADVDDPTIRRCVGSARTWGWNAVRVANLYALRSAHPAALWISPDPVGPANDQHLLDYAQAAQVSSAPLVAAWGANARPDRFMAVRRLTGLDQLQCLGITKAGQPRHPLYVRGDTELQPWPQP